MHDTPGRRCASRHCVVAHGRWSRRIGQVGVRSRVSKGPERKKCDLLTFHNERYRPDRGLVEDLNIAGALRPACRNNLVPTGGDIPAANAASSLVIPCAIPNQNRWSSDRPATGGRPGDANGARPERCDRRFRMPIATSFVQVLRRPLESALRSLIRMMQKTVGLAPAPDRHDEGVGDELRRHLRLRRTSYRLPREERLRPFLGYRAPPSASRLPCAAGRSPTAPASSGHGRGRHAADRSRCLPDPLAQHVLVQIQIAGSLRNGNTPILHQPHCLKLELGAELPSSRSNSPVPSNTLSRCPRNRQQASSPGPCRSALTIRSGPR